MKLFKSVLVAASLALSLGTFSTSAVACEDGRTCVPFSDAVKMIDGHINMAIEAIDKEHDTATILLHIKQAKDLSKEINENDKVDIARGRANGLLKKAKSAVRKGEMAAGDDVLRAARAKFASLARLRN
ncbi:MAG: hypothetical protein HFP81_01065 [Methylococcales symbiont of Hymedesmia sp. n. MRB-2018]|nr:MAG: hypothetical protein HFP78_02325 [Methylococcales symbiont of Hymedesmia sp. n. MRB-2018]KAF3984638.1 MAG: hypothetical protein HFP81_01065 [Methylococcales symbiont of Hymedesmia sp. n. MRB-2018]